uniref:UPF0500 protein C1orf216 homolog n=1 Tax=Sinocyclocheilus rhinocerous TaxID=307959 RepID=A0A673HTA2_9TELE
MLQQDRAMNPVLGSRALVGPQLTLRIHTNSQKRCEKDGNFNFLGQDDDSMTGDENRNQVRPRALVRDLPLSANHYGPGPLSPLSHLPCWSSLEPLPEIESGDDMGGRVPPDGAHNSIWDQICHERPTADNGNATADTLKNQNRVDKKAERRQESLEGTDAVEDSSSDSNIDPCSELPDLMEAVWTLQDRERFKAQEMEKHQVQLTMYRRLALIRWVRTLQNRVQEQQNRLQSSFDVILTHRKELLRMGAATAAQ